MPEDPMQTPLREAVDVMVIFGRICAELFLTSFSFLSSDYHVVYAARGHVMTLL